MRELVPRRGTRKRKRGTSFLSDGKGGAASLFGADSTSVGERVAASMHRDMGGHFPAYVLSKAGQREREMTESLLFGFCVQRSGPWAMWLFSRAPLLKRTRWHLL